MPANITTLVRHRSQSATPYVFLITPLLAIVFPKSLAALVPALGVLALVDLVLCGRWNGLKRASDASLIVLAFFVWATLSALWANDPMAAFSRGAVGLMTVVAAYLVLEWCRASQDVVQKSAPWFVLGFGLGVGFLVFELATNQLLSKIVVTGLTGRDVQPFKLNLNMTVATLLLWPAMLAAGLFVASPKGRMLQIALAVSVFLAVLWSVHETTKVSLAIGLFAMIAAVLSPVLTRMGLLAAWVIATLLIVPLAIVAHVATKTSDSPWLQSSIMQSGTVRHRIVIWGNISQRVFEAPIIGHGTRSIYKINADDKKNGKGLSAIGLDAIPPHAHNIYVQTWFELGAIGALLFCGAGVLLLLGLAGVPAQFAPFGAAAAANGIVQMFPSFELWQQWYLAALSLGCVTTIAALRLAMNKHDHSS